MIGKLALGNPYVICTILFLIFAHMNLISRPVSFCRLALGFSNETCLLSLFFLFLTFLSRVHPSGSPRRLPHPPSPQNFLKQAPGQITSADVRQNAVAIHSVAQIPDAHKRTPANRPDVGKTNERRRVWNVHASSRSAESNRGKPWNRVNAVSTRGTRRTNPSRGSRLSKTPDGDPLELAVGNVATEEIRYLQNSSPPKRKVN